MLANLDARNFGADRLELATNFRRRVQLQIEHILVRRSAWQKDHDDRLVRFADAGLCLGAQQFGQGQTAQAKRADLEEIAARNAVTKARAAAVYRQHKPSLNLCAKSSNTIVGHTI